MSTNLDAKTEIHPMSRRRFLGRTAICGTGLLVLKSPRLAWSAQANEKLSVALIGVGGRGDWFVETIPKLENVVALCDVSEQKLTGAFKRWEELTQRFADSPNDWERRAAEAYRCTASNVATQFEETLEFDPVQMKVVNNPAADALLRCEYRRGWAL